MSEQLPTPQFNASQYERPNQDWVCGIAKDGKSCRLGPDARGNCRTTCECQPVLEIKPGETKGRYRCTRPADFGGPCATGPLPDGKCARPVARCLPERSVRAKRKVFTFAAIMVSTGFLLVALCGPWRWNFISPGELSAQHSTPTFARLAKEEGNCVVCHGAARGGISTWVQTGLAARPSPLALQAFASKGETGLTAIDGRCLHCHAGHAFHEPNIDSDHSCSDCHQEHKGSGRMAAPGEAACLSCHANASVMQASAQKGKTLPAAAFNFRPSQGRVLFAAHRPPEGYTRVIHGFATDHPEFQVLAEDLPDPDTLKFNHKLHLTSPTISALRQGKKLVCADCHQPDAAGVYYLKITYEQNCRQCHSLQFDVRNPGLPIPHGNSATVHAFLHSLPQQYADFAAAQRGITGQKEIENFVRDQIDQLRAAYGSGEELEQRVFFDDAHRGPISTTGGVPTIGPAIFPGCAYCHQVTAAPNVPLQITPPLKPDRWLTRGNFDHSKHIKVACSTCHDATHSERTADVLLPSQQTCIQCHSPQGGVASSCSTCHNYHASGR